MGLCEMRWKNFGEMSTDVGHKVYFSGEEDKHEYGVGFLVHKDIVDAVLECRPVSRRLISIRLRAAHFNITIIQVNAPTSGHDDSEVDHFYQQLQETIDQTPNKSTASGAKYARSSVIFPHRMAFVRGGVDAVKRGPKLNMIKNFGKGIGG